MDECCITGFDSFDLHTTCHCGQAFRWRRTSGAGADGVDGVDMEEGVVRGKLLRLEQRGGALVVHPPVDSATMEVVMDYFRLRTPHAHIEQEIASIDPIMAAAVEHSRGLRLVAQEPWECLVSYILSARNGIPQISRAIENIARGWGRPLGDCQDEATRFSFPGPRDLACAEECQIVACKAGFRSRAVCEAAHRAATGETDLDAITAMEYPAAKEELIRLRGVGEKVADCVLLFSMGKFEAFPVDVWIERAVRCLYFGGAEIPHREIRRWASDKFGNLAGYAQEYLFAYARETIPDELRGASHSKK
ncbi:MAG: DNA glycosylase [Clostridia bacterium]|nr:DNA glycosylase [Clostridia bacterium]